jgi:hypothetical protein
MRTTRVWTLILLASGAGLLVSCSELKDDLKQPVAGGGGIHGEAWSDVTSPEFHGRYLKTKSWEDQECKSCHGGDYAGGTSGVSCFTCHPAYPHQAVFPGNRHTTYLRQTLFPLDQCQVCHGVTYAGGPIAEISCLTSGCHVDVNGAQKSPEACNTCHGNFRAPETDLLATAPPKSVAGDTATTVPGVGAHAAHLTYGTALQSIKCAECHAVPAVWNAANHLGFAPADVAMSDTLATTVTGGGTNVPAPTYDAGSNSCGQVYCHGNFELRRSNAPAQYAFAYADTVIRGGVAGSALPGGGWSRPSAVWTLGPTQTTCGASCHALPPVGHLASGPTCNGCHSGVTDANNNIIDQRLHVNGKVNVFGTERPMQ